MSLLPSDYYPTTQFTANYKRVNTSPYYFDNSGNTIYSTTLEDRIDLANREGFTYTAPLLRAPETYFLDPTRILGITSSDITQEIYYFLKQLPEGKRGLQPFTFNTYAVIHQFLTDGITIPGETTSINWYRDDLTLTGNITGLYWSPWPTKGVEVVKDFYTKWMQGASITGATVDFVLVDEEARTFLDGWGSSSTRRNILVGLTQYFNQWRGLTSFNNLYQEWGMTLGLTQSYNENAFRWTKEHYRNKARTEAYLPGISQYFPNALLSNYDNYIGIKDPFGYSNSVNEDGFVVRATYTGNASSPYIYGWIRQIDKEREGNPQAKISFDNPTQVLVKGAEPFWPWLHPRNQYLTTGPWASFLVDMSEIREAKRNAPNIPLTPWIGDMYWSGDYQFKSPIYDITDSAQSPAEVLHTTWWRQNIARSEIISGITSFDGTTSGFVISQSVLGTTGACGGLWYKQNVSGITYDGNTQSFEIKTIGTTGTTAAVALYYGQIANGITYIFSYELDCGRGFSGSRARFTSWNTTDAITLAPLRPTATTSFSGITFEQLLPSVTGPFNLEAPIIFNGGESGWTKVSWRFVGSSTNQRVGMHIYYATNSLSITGGYTSYVRNAKLELESSGATLSNPVDYRYLAPSYDSLRYFYNGITSGTTYEFSYYVDPTRGYTLGIQQIIEHSHSSPLGSYGRLGFGVPRGITFTQTSPQLGCASYNYSSLNYGYPTGWTKIAFEFSVPPDGDTYDPIFNNTLSLSVLGLTYSYSVLESGNLPGFTYYVSTPQLKIKGTTQDIDLFTRMINDEYQFVTWREGPPTGYVEASTGYNSKQGKYFTKRGGNSAYFYELVNHICLHGTKGIGWFNWNIFIDHGITGTLTLNANGAGSAALRNNYFLTGTTQYLTPMLQFNQNLHEVHEKIKGYTITTADYSPINWMQPYFASGAPDARGLTWWWRITVKPGWTLYCNGMTLNSNSNIGMWLGTTGPTLAGIPITIEEPPYPSEPAYSTPVKEVNFLGMTGVDSLITAGLTFIRGSSATYINSSGILTTVGRNQPRFDYEPNTLRQRGLLLESPATNFLNWSESFASTGGVNNNWNDVNLTRITGNTSPAGTTNAIRFVANSENAYLLSSSGITVSTFNSFSVWLRGITGNENVSYTIDGGTSWNSISGVSSTWYRYAFVPTFGSSHVGIRLGNTGNAVEIWGAQVESRTFASGSWSSTTKWSLPSETSYIPTQSTTAGRSADTCYFTKTDIDLWYGITYGTLLFEFENYITPYLRKSSTPTETIQFFPPNKNAASSTSVGVNTSGFNTPFYSFEVSNTGSKAKDIPMRMLFTYSPRGIKFNAGDNFAYRFATSRDFDTFWTGVTQGPIKQLDFLYLRDTSTGIDGHGYCRKFKYWNRVMDDLTIEKMVQAEVPPYKWLNPYG